MYGGERYIIEINVYSAIMPQREILDGIHTLYRIAIAIIRGQKPGIFPLDKLSRFGCAPQLFTIRLGSVISS